ncbi:MAG: Coenzyme F420 hydrogenase/dehydrogenase, beta subunit C-terminal domain, partial [Fusobacteriaceae bacterium]
MEDLKPLQKSKYLQSKMDNSYREVKQYLKDGKKVLFVGAPCQIAALNTMVNHENLVTVDVICHGLPSYKAFDKYIRESFNLNIKNVEVDFRNKDEGW